LPHQALVRALSAKKVVQLGQLVMVTGPDTLDSDVLAAAIISTVEAPTWKQRSRGGQRAKSFNSGGKRLAYVSRPTGKAMVRTESARRRAETGQCRTDTRE